jgi:hypothetical protein
MKIVNQAIFSFSDTSRASLALIIMSISIETTAFVFFLSYYILSAIPFFDLNP